MDFLRLGLSNDLYLEGNDARMRMRDTETKRFAFFFSLSGCCWDGMPGEFVDGVEGDERGEGGHRESDLPRRRVIFRQSRRSERETCCEGFQLLFGALSADVGWGPRRVLNGLKSRAGGRYRIGFVVPSRPLRWNRRLLRRYQGEERLRRPWRPRGRSEAS